MTSSEEHATTSLHPPFQSSPYRPKVLFNMTLVYGRTQRRAYNDTPEPYGSRIGRDLSFFLFLHLSI